MAQLTRRGVHYIWRILYPIAIHFGISQILVGMVLALLIRNGYGENSYMQYALLVTAVSGLLAMIPAYWFFRKDQEFRRNSEEGEWHVTRFPDLWEGILLLMMGGGLSLYVNILMGVLQNLIPDTSYTEMMGSVMTGKSFLFLILTMGILAPLTEEMIFRWLVFLRLREHLSCFWAVLISAALFGIYHGNLFQGIYAGILGIVFAWVLEKSASIWSSVLLHIGANVLSLVLTVYGEWLLQNAGTIPLTLLSAGLLFSLIFGCRYYKNRNHN